MKYLKPFNENNGRTQEELLDLCEGSLAYLLDEGFLVGYTDYIKPNIKLIKISKPNTEGPTYNFSWNEIKDYFIPFIQRLITTEELYTNIAAIKTGIVFKYIKPKYIHHAKANAPWYENSTQYETKMFQPTTQQIINDEILDEPSTIYSTAKCMNYIYEINILLQI
ncbi:MAG: hypothetical protein ABFD07_06890 [Methanobacterium sp.]